ncbi:MAG: hypothetical protein HWD58_07695 [Bacteroidota bacterium]|nr:MAG: hypothetical protein HWD58_07695 [Bacteroidota bacterium]
MAFSSDGNRLAIVHSTQADLFIADFDRCTGELSNPKIVNIPYDSTTIPNPGPQQIIDSVVGGVCFLRIINLSMFPSGIIFTNTNGMNLTVVWPGTGLSRVRIHRI